MYVFSATGTYDMIHLDVFVFVLRVVVRLSRSYECIEALLLRGGGISPKLVFFGEVRIYFVPGTKYIR